MKKIKYKLLLVFTVLFLILAGGLGGTNTFSIINNNADQLESYEKTLLDQYDLLVTNQVESAYSIMDSIYNRFKSGELTEQEAQLQAILDIKAMRFGDSGYFWIDQTDGMLVAHPMSPETEGSNRTNLQDPEGTLIIQNVISAATSNEQGGFTEYIWEKPNTDGFVKKRVYSLLFKPWNYIISTGNYIDDIEAHVTAKETELSQELKQDLTIQIIIFLTLLLISAIISYLFSNRMANQITKVTNHVKRIADNDLLAPDLAISTKDEIGQLSNATNHMVANLRGILTDMVKASEKVNAHSEELTESAGEVKEGSSQVAFTMHELALGAETQAVAATDLSNSMAEFAAKIEEANNLSQQVSYSSHEVQQLANKGSMLMASSIQQMTSIDQIVHDSVLKVQSLNNQSEQISEIVTVVNGIAAQTNLLALNASIEAARAGEHGRGFAIVANEVKKLSEQVSYSISGITEILNGITTESSHIVSSLQDGYQEVKKGTEQIKLTGRTLANIDTAVSDMAKQIQSITDALSGITAKSVDMNQSIENVAAVSQESAAGVEQTTASIEQTKSAMVEIAHSAEELSQLAENLNGLVRQFKV